MNIRTSDKNGRFSATRAFLTDPQPKKKIKRSGHQKPAVFSQRYGTLSFPPLACSLLMRVGAEMDIHNDSLPMNGRRWYAVYSKPHKEEFAQSQLRLKGLDVFFPRLLLPQSSQRHRRIVPLFPNYLFVRIRIPDEYAYVAWSPGVKKLVTFNGVPPPIDEQVVAFLKGQASPQGIILAQSNLRVGQAVAITGGPLAGLVGIIQAPPNSKNRVEVLLQLMNRQIKVQLPTEFVESRGDCSVAGAKELN